MNAVGNAVTVLRVSLYVIVNNVPAWFTDADENIGAALTGVEVVWGEETEFASTLVATDVNVYDVPLTKPEITHDPEDPVTVHVRSPGCAVTTKLVGTAPVDAAATVTVAFASLATTVGAGGWLGAAYTLE